METMDLQTTGTVDGNVKYSEQALMNLIARGEVKTIYYTPAITGWPCFI
jgi:hypothetical protein